MCVCVWLGVCYHLVLFTGMGADPQQQGEHMASMEVALSGWSVTKVSPIAGTTELLQQVMPSCLGKAVG